MPKNPVELCAQWTGYHEYYRPTSLVGADADEIKRKYRAQKPNGYGLYASVPFGGSGHFIPGDDFDISLKGSEMPASLYETPILALHDWKQQGLDKLCDLIDEDRILHHKPFV